jgi:hypothetical protein
MKKNILYLLLLLSYYPLCAQTEPVTGLKYIDNGKFDSIFRRHETATPVPPTYFVITFDPTLSALTLVPEVIKAYKEVRQFSKQMPLYIVYLNSGVVSNEAGDEDRYFKEIFYIDREKDKNVYFKQDDKLYDSLNIFTMMTKWFYVYNYRLLGGANSVKLHALSDAHYNLPKDIIELGKPKKTKIHPNNLRLSARRDIIRPYSAGKLLYITDMNNDLHLLNTVTGQFEKISNKQSFNYLDFYCQYISKSDTNCQIAKANNDLQFNRDPNYFSGVTHSNSNIYVSTGFEMTVPWESSVYAGLKYMTYVNELGEKQKVKYEFIGESYPALLKFDTSFNYLDAYYVNTNSYPKENRVPAKAGFWGGLDRGFYIKDSLLIIDNNPDASVPLKVLPKNANHAYSVFKLGANNTYNFDHFLPIEYDKNYVKYMNWHSRTYYFQLKDKLYANMLNGGYINELNDDNTTIRLKGLGDKLIEEKIPAFSEDTTWLTVNYRSLCANSIFDERYALVIYYFQDKPVLELLERDDITGNLKTVQVTDLFHTEGFTSLEFKAPIPNNGDGLCISDNKIYMSRHEKGEYFLYEYPIILKRKVRAQQTNNLLVSDKK